MIKYFLFALTALFLLSCSEDNSGPSAAIYEDIVAKEGYLPLKVGNWWLYGAQADRLVIKEGPTKVNPEWMSQYGIDKRQSLPMYKAHLKSTVYDTLLTEMFFVKGLDGYYLIVSEADSIFLKAVLPYELTSGDHIISDCHLDVAITNTLINGVYRQLFDIHYSTYRNSKVISNGSILLEKNVGIHKFNYFWGNMTNYHLE